MDHDNFGGTFVPVGGLLHLPKEKDLPYDRPSAGQCIKQGDGRLF